MGLEMSVALFCAVFSLRKKVSFSFLALVVSLVLNPLLVVPRTTGWLVFGSSVHPPDSRVAAQGAMDSLSKAAASCPCQVGIL